MQLPSIVQGDDCTQNVATRRPRATWRPPSGIDIGVPRRRTVSKASLLPRRALLDTSIYRHWTHGPITLTQSGRVRPVQPHAASSSTVFLTPSMDVRRTSRPSPSATINATLQLVSRGQTKLGMTVDTHIWSVSKRRALGGGCIPEEDPLLTHLERGSRRRLGERTFNLIRIRIARYSNTK